MERPLARNRSFAILLGGQWVSGIGNNLFELAVFWFVLATTHRPADLGLVGAAMALPGVLGLFSGVLVDRADRRRMMIGSDLVRAFISLLLGFLAYMHVLPLALFLVLVLLLMAAGTFFNPAVMALLPQIVSADDLPRANGLLGSGLQSASLVGMLGGGVMMAALGPILLFIANGVSFLVSVGSLLVMSTPPPLRVPSGPRPKASELVREWKDGVRLVWSVPLLRTTILLGVFVNFVFQGLTVLFAAWVKGPLHGNAFDYALIGVGVSVGIILGGLLAGAVLKVVPLARALPATLLLMGLSVVILARVPSLFVSLAMLLVLGINVGILNTGIVTAMQEATPPAMMGRVFGTLSSLATLANPVGAAAFGGLAAFWSLPFIFLVIGAAVMVTALPLLVPAKPRAPADAGAAGA